MAGMPNGWGPMGLTDAQLDTTLAKIKAKATEIGADANLLRRCMIPCSHSGHAETGGCLHPACTPCHHGNNKLSLWSAL